MRDILKRKSVIMLICIFFAGFLGPMLISGHPSDVTGSLCEATMVECQASPLF